MKQTFRYKRERKKAFRCNNPGTYSYTSSNAFAGDSGCLISIALFILMVIGLGIILEGGAGIGLTLIIIGILGAIILFVTNNSTQPPVPEVGIISNQTPDIMWAKNGDIIGVCMPWLDAMNWVKTLNYGDYTDWRLPTIEELTFLLKSTDGRPDYWLNANGFSNVKHSFYWSSSTTHNGDCYAWCVYMGDGANKIGTEILKSQYSYSWPVRDAKGVSSLET